MTTVFRTFINYREQGPDLEVNELPSMTQPDEVMSIREMLIRHVRGLPPVSSSGPGEFYPESVGYVPSLPELDLVDIESASSRFSRLTSRFKELLTPKPPESGAADRPPNLEVASTVSDSDPAS